MTVYIDLEPVPFHKGFYSVDMTFFFDVELDVFMAPAAMPVNVKGLSIFNKKVILYGSEGNVKIFSSDFKLDDPDIPNAPVKNLPKASVQVAKPIGLSAKLCTRREPCIPCCRYRSALQTATAENWEQRAKKTYLLRLGSLRLSRLSAMYKCLYPHMISAFRKKNAPLHQTARARCSAGWISRQTSFFPRR